MFFSELTEIWDPTLVHPPGPEKPVGADRSIYGKVWSRDSFLELVKIQTIICAVYLTQDALFHSNFHKKMFNKKIKNKNLINR